MFCESQLNGALETSGVDRFPDVAVGLRLSGALKGAAVFICRQVDDGDIELFANPLGDLDSVLVPFDADVHQDEVGRSLADRTQGFAARGGYCGHGITGGGQPSSQIGGDEALVFDDDNFVSFSFSHFAHTLSFNSDPLSSRYWLGLVPSSDGSRVLAGRMCL